MNPNKAVAIAKLKNGESFESISKELDISTSLIQEWAEELSPNDMISKEINAIAIQKANKLLRETTNNTTEQLQVTLLSMAMAITDEVKIGLHDHEIAKAINLSADTVAKLQSAFFTKGTQIAFINNPNNSSDELKTFRGTLRD